MPEMFTVLVLYLQDSGDFSPSLPAFNVDEKWDQLIFLLFGRKLSSLISSPFWTTDLFFEILSRFRFFFLSISVLSLMDSYLGKTIFIYRLSHIFCVDHSLLLIIRQTLNFSKNFSLAFPMISVSLLSYRDESQFAFGNQWLWPSTTPAYWGAYWLLKVWRSRPLFLRTPLISKCSLIHRACLFKMQLLSRISSGALVRISLKILSSFQINCVPLRIIHSGGPWALLFKAIESFQVSPAFQVYLTQEQRTSP